MGSENIPDKCKVVERKISINEEAKLGKVSTTIKFLPKIIKFVRR